jgi:hypothetical protein
MCTDATSIMTLIELCHVVQTLRAQGHRLREISRLLTLSRTTVNRIRRAGASPSAPRAPGMSITERANVASHRKYLRTRWVRKNQHTGVSSGER